MCQPEQHTVTFYYFGSLPGLLKPRYRAEHVRYHFKEHPSVKDAIEAMGIPHTEVDIILANGGSVDFHYQLQDDDAIYVYPFGSSTARQPVLHLTPQPPEPIRFILDVHLGKLARRLRLLGFDCTYQNDLDDAEIMQISLAEDRIILTRDRGILKHRKVLQGYLVRYDHVDEQVEEILIRYSLSDSIQPWLRCMTCNGLLEVVEKTAILHRLEPKTRFYFDTFRRCSNCNKIYWQGSHYEKIKDWLAKFQK